MGCVDNCSYQSDASETYWQVVEAMVSNAVSAVVMTETGSNTGVFESFDVNGAAEFETSAQAAC